MFFDLPGTDGQELNAEMERVQNRAAGAQSAAEQMSPQDLYKVLWQILSFRDSVMKSVEVSYHSDSANVAEHYRPHSRSQLPDREDQQLGVHLRHHDDGAVRQAPHWQCHQRPADLFAGRH